LEGIRQICEQPISENKFEVKVILFRKLESKFRC